MTEADKSVKNKLDLITETERMSEQNPLPTTMSFDRSPMPPSEKQLAFMHSLRESIGLDIPQKALEDRRAASAWIDEMKKLGGALHKPTDKQILFARQLEQEVGLKLSEEDLTDAKALSLWIEKAKERQRPTEKQISFAMELAKKNQIDLPNELLSSKKALSAWLDTILGNDKFVARGKDPKKIKKNK